MRYLKPLFHFFHRIFEILVGFFTFYFMLFVMGMLISTGSIRNHDDYQAFVSSNGVHTDICLPVHTGTYNWTERIPLSDFPEISNPMYISIGWGDKGFYLDTPTWDDLTFGTAFYAAFLPSPTAMHVTYLNSVPEVDEQCKRVPINAAQYVQLIEFINNTFSENENGVQLIGGKGYGMNDNFYEAKGSYHLFRTCNTWTNEALKSAGICTSLFALSADGILTWL